MYAGAISQAVASQPDAESRPDDGPFASFGPFTSTTKSMPTLRQSASDKLRSGVGLRTSISRGETRLDRLGMGTHNPINGQRRWYIIDPRTSKSIGYWDATTLIALVFTAIVTPFEVAFLNAPDTAADPLFIINRVVDCVFLVDMILQFLLMYPLAQGADSISVHLWVSDPGKIAKHYVLTWFFPDLISVLVSAFDILAVVGGATALANFKAFRVIRALRLIKMLRLVRASRMLKRWETRLEINYAYLALAQAFLSITAAAHWFGCFWMLVATVGSQDDESDLLNTWLGTFGYCWALPAPPSAPPSAPGSVGGGGGFEIEVKCDGPWTLYCASVYWAAATITSIGYGDIHATASNAGELIVCAILMILGAMLWGSTIATFCGIHHQLDMGGAAFRHRMDMLNSFMRKHALPVEMRRNLREYFHQRHQMGSGNNAAAVMAHMSPALLSKVVLQCNERWLRPVPFLVTAGEHFIVHLALALQQMLFAPGESLPPGKLYIVHRGVALYGGSIFTAGKSWGADMILSNPRLKLKWSGRAMNYLEVWHLSRTELLSVAECYPRDRKRLRRHVILLALRREMLRLANEARAVDAPCEESIGVPTAFSMRTHTVGSSVFTGGLSKLSETTESEEALYASLMGGTPSRAQSSSSFRREGGGATPGAPAGAGSTPSMVDSLGNLSRRQSQSAQAREWRFMGTAEAEREKKGLPKRFSLSYEGQPLFGHESERTSLSRLAAQVADLSAAVKKVEEAQVKAQVANFQTHIEILSRLDAHAAARPTSDWGAEQLDAGGAGASSGAHLPPLLVHAVLKEGGGGPPTAPPRTPPASLRV